MRGNCKLCEKSTELKLSHVIPSSIYKWIKNTSGTGILRKSKNPNKPTQDGYKYYWLCGDCEQKIGVYEKYFIEKIFRPVNNGKYINEFKYDEKLFYFICSIWWRLIQVSLTEEDVLNCEYLSNIKCCEKELKDFLNEFKYPINFDNNYLLLLGEVKQAPPKYKNINFVFLRSVDPLLMFDKSSCYLSLRIPHFYFFGNICGLNKKMLKTVKLNPAGGKYVVDHTPIVEPNITSFINQRIWTFNNIMENVTQIQKEKTTQRHVKDLEKFRKSKSFEAWILDREREKDI